jgi:MFS family permease
MGSIAPAAGSISDLFGRRYSALLGSIFVFIGIMMMGLTHDINVAMGGMAISGVGAAFSGIIGISGISEIAPMKDRGKYLGTAFLLVLPFGACNEYGLSRILELG